MERLTHKARYEAGYKLNKGVKEWQAADRLGAYENIGLTPDKIMELKERDTARAPEPAPLGMDGMVCPSCRKKALPWDRFCGECGQRFWEDD